MFGLCWYTATAKGRPFVNVSLAKAEYNGFISGASGVLGDSSVVHVLMQRLKSQLHRDMALAEWNTLETCFRRHSRL